MRRLAIVLALTACTPRLEHPKLVSIGPIGETILLHDVRLFAAVDANGLVTVRKSGETAIMVRSLGVVNAARVAVSLRLAQANYQRPKSANYIDDFIFGKMRQDNIPHAPPASDAEFLRRVYLDLTGRIPGAATVRAFLDREDPQKRSALIRSA